MTTTEQTGPRPKPDVAVRADLVESRDGWTLTLHADEQTAAALRAAGLERIRMSVSPNLVPGEPFDVDTVHVVGT